MTNAATRLLLVGKFNLVGLLGAALQLLLVCLFANRFGLSNLAATPLAIEIVVLHNFIWHERFTWRGRQLKGLRQVAIRLWRFQICNGFISLGGNTILMHCLVEWLKAPLVPSAIGAIVLCSPANFLLADRWVYANGPLYKTSGSGGESVPYQGRTIP